MTGGPGNTSGVGPALSPQPQLQQSGMVVRTLFCIIVVTCVESVGWSEAEVVSMNDLMGS